jgi:uncharacterized membrane protein YGL010W
MPTPSPELPEKQHSEGYTMLGKSRDEWIRQYSTSHQNSVNRACHTVGIPLIAVSILMIPLAIWRPHVWWWMAGLFVAGWVFQFIGHAFEGKPPEFLKDWRFLFVGLSWWFAKLAGKA